MSDLRCFFCGRPRSEVARLIAGPTAYICNECVVLCMQILEEEPVEPRTTEGQLLVRFPDGTVHVCEQHEPWRDFVVDGEDFQWCLAAGFVRSPTPLVVVAVRRRGVLGPIIGATFPVCTTVTETDARALVHAYDGAARLMEADAPAPPPRAAIGPDTAGKHAPFANGTEDELKSATGYDIVASHRERARATDCDRPLLPAQPLGASLARRSSPRWYARKHRMKRVRRVRRLAAAGALSTACAAAILLLARESTSAPPSPVPGDVSVEAAPSARERGCLVEVKGPAKGRGPCTVEHFTQPPSDGGFSAEWTTVRIVGRSPTLVVDLSFFDEPLVGPQSAAADGGSRRRSYATARIDRDGQVWEARSHVESDFEVTVSSVKATCNDGGLKCWEIHGRVHANVPSAVLSPFAPPLDLSMTF